MDASLIGRLARLRGIGDAYHDYRGELRYFTLETKAGILRAMGCDPENSAGLAAEISRLQDEGQRRLLPSVAAVHGERALLELNIAARDFGASLGWTLIMERGGRRSGHLSSAECPEIWRGEVDGSWITRRRFELPLDLPAGYHALELSIAGRPAERSMLIASPPECHEPAAIRAGRRLWGVAVQLYAVRSRENWGIGDFRDLEILVRWLGARGAGFVGLNPLHALAPADPERASPYSASNRHFLNVLYIAVPAVPDYGECAAACARVADGEFARRLSELRAVPQVDYRGVAEVKLEILDLVYREFRERHLARGTARAAAFRAFVQRGGSRLHLHACFDALDRHFRASHGTASGWLSWPAEYRDAAGPGAQRFAQEHALQVEFHLYTQWLAHEQLAAAQALALELGMPVGLYGDYAVGAHPSGSETWADHRVFRMDAEIGAPPDPLALKGQGWGIPPPDPLVMESEQLQGFVGLIRNNMRHYGALRLDHVMSLFRLWWVPAGSSPTEGAYVHYPLRSLLTALALESSRGGCMVIGEDLGVVPDEVRHAIPEFGLYHYKVLLFEKQDGRFRRPDEFVRRALATAATHDMPTLRGYWEGRDIELRRSLQLYPSVEMANDVERERGQDRAALLAALREQGLAPGAADSPAPPFTPELAHALHLYLARSGAALVALQIEDLLGMDEPVNVPGTHLEYPNWQRKLSAELEEMIERADLDRCFAEINRARD